MQNTVNTIHAAQVASVLLAAACITVLLVMYLVLEPRQRKIRCELAEKYRFIYRVISIPPETQIVVKAEGASIQAGDYGWEAESVRQDGLIYLHGLNEKWQVVWYAAFDKDQIEVAGTKPKSQYYCFPDWVKHNIPPCPFPVKMPPNGNLGFPVQIADTWIQGKHVLY